MFRKRFKKGKAKEQEGFGTSLTPRSALTAVPLSVNPPAIHSLPHVRPEDDPFSDPDSSLYDFEQANEPGYATVDFGTLERRKRLAEQKRGPLPVPETVANDNNNAGETYHILEPGSVTARSDLDLLYATPIKTKLSRNETPKKSPSREGRLSNREGRQSNRSSHRLITGGSSLRDTTGEVRRVMRELHTLPAEPVHEPMVKMTRTTMSAVDARRLTPRNDRISDTQVVSQLEQQVVVLQEKNNELSSQNEALSKVAAALDEGDMENAQATLLRKQIQDIKDEREALKTSVHRLNVELSKYQAKYRPVTYGKETHDIVGLPSKGPIPSWLINTKYLAPLFLAYDDQLTAKENLIQQYKSQLESLKTQAQEVIGENERLRSRGPERLTGSSPTTPAEWQQIQDQARLVLEENQVLMEQLDVQQHKSADMAAAHSQQMARLSRQLVASEASRSEAEKEVVTVTTKYDEMKVLVDRTLMDSPLHVTTHQHSSVVQELKTTICEQQDRHDKDVADLETKLQAMTLERNDLVMKVTDLTSEIQQREGQLSTVDKAFRKYEDRIRELYDTIESVQKDELSAQKQLAKIIHVAENSAFERDTYAKVAKDQEGETRKALSKLLAGNITVGKLQEKLKQYKLTAASKLSTIAEQMKEMDSSFDCQREEFSREIRHLQLLLKEKEILLQSAESDKEQVSQDLEVMWQAASSENGRMKEALKRSFRRIDRAASAVITGDDIINDDIINDDDISDDDQ